MKRPDTDFEIVASTTADILYHIAQKQRMAEYVNSEDAQAFVGSLINQAIKRALVGVDRDAAVPVVFDEHIHTNGCTHPFPFTVLTAGAPVVSPSSEPLDSNRCAVCGWPLRRSVNEGCVRGNCSMRPLPGRAYDAARAVEENGYYESKYGSKIFPNRVSPSSEPPPAYIAENVPCADCGFMLANHRRRFVTNEEGAHYEAMPACPHKGNGFFKPSTSPTDTNTEKS